MLQTVFTKTLRDLRKGLLGWGIGVAVLVGLMAWFWPSVRDMPDLEEFLDAYPEVMQEMFDVGAISTPEGFFNIELFSIMLPALFIIFAVGRGSRLIAGEEETGTMEVLAVMPIPRQRILLEKAAALAVAVAALGVVLIVSVMLASAAVGMSLGIADVTVAALGVTLLGIEYGWLALAVGAVTASRPAAVGASSAAAAAGYLIYVIGEIVDPLEPLRPASPFTQALRDGPLGASEPATAYLWLLLGAVVVLAASLQAWARRDVALP